MGLPRLPKNPKVCATCGEEFRANSSSQRYCDGCRTAPRTTLSTIELSIVCEGCDVPFRRRSGNQRRCDPCRMKTPAGRVRRSGVGSGNWQEVSEDNPFYRTGAYSYISKKLRSVVIPKCERCETDLTLEIASRKKSRWAVHHKDGNHSNQELGNLELLCVVCHNRAHENWKYSKRCQGIVQSARKLAC